MQEAAAHGTGEASEGGRRKKGGGVLTERHGGSMRPAARNGDGGRDGALATGVARERGGQARPRFEEDEGGVRKVRMGAR
jgi:hypothetical protein